MRAFTDADALVVAAWRYDGPWSIYNVSDPSSLSSDYGYHAVIDTTTGVLVGFVCFGIEARIPGFVEDFGVVDVGVGIDPQLVGLGRGHALIAPVLEWIESRSPKMKHRVFVQDWNERSLRLRGALGFEEADHRRSVRGRGTPMSDREDATMLLDRRGRPGEGS